MVLIKFLLKACLWLVDSLLLRPHVGSSWSQELRPRKKANSDGFFLLIPSQGQEGPKRLKEKNTKEKNIKIRIVNKEYFEKRYIKQRGWAGKGGVGWALIALRRREMT